MTSINIVDLEHGGQFDAGNPIDPGSDPDGQRAYQNLEKSLTFLEKTFGCTSTAEIDCCIHWGSALANATWGRGRLLLGDGDGCHRSYTHSLSVVMHELTHSLVEEVGLSSASESMAVNEHLCDVFGILAKQWQQMMNGEPSDWLFGSEIRICTESGQAIRNMLHPDEDSRDSGATTWLEAQRNSDDYYFNVGVLNRAFALATDAIPELPWESTGQIWHRTLKSLPWSCNIPQFANLVLANAGEFDAQVSAAFRKVGLVA